MKKLIIVDYGLGNLFSINQACLNAGINAVISNDKNDIFRADALIIPGVGSFGEAMKNLKSKNLIEPLNQAIDKQIPTLGICLGMQILFEKSEESPNINGLGIIKGKVKKFPKTFNEEKLKAPQIAWNTIHQDKISWKDTPLESIKNNSYMYFVHSYYTDPEDIGITLCRTDYKGFNYVSGLMKNNIFALQFHPEKSGLDGLKVYKKFIDLI